MAMRTEPLSAASVRSPVERIEELRCRADPRANRADVAGRYDELFRAGAVPDPRPDGFLPGALEATTTFPALDAYGRWVSRLWMPWAGKRFDAATETGANRLTPSARIPMRLFWPSHRPGAAEGGALEAFPFRTRIEPAALDSGTDVLVIDYDFEANPAFIIRRIRDELVQVDDGFYLGKVLMRFASGYRRIGFFSLRRP